MYDPLATCIIPLKGLCMQADLHVTSIISRFSRNSINSVLNETMIIVNYTHFCARKAIPPPLQVYALSCYLRMKCTCIIKSLAQLGGQFRGGGGSNLEIGMVFCFKVKQTIRGDDFHMTVVNLCDDIP
jgi:hypothetical protein